MSLFRLAVAGLILIVPQVGRGDVPSQQLWKAGTARAVITPQKPIWMAGYASRPAPAEGKLHELYIRVLALEDAKGNRGIVVSTDTLGIPKEMYDEISIQLKSRFRLDRSQVLLNASHTHCGPVLKSALYDAYALTQDQQREIEEYSDWLTAEIVSTIGKALEDLQPATLSRGTGFCDFAVNRRTNLEPNVPTLREQNLLMGPVDHTVPVLSVRSENGQLKAVVFIYACHNTTLSFQKWCGDYAGFAQYSLEEHNPGVTAMFCMGCGADQNPLPRRTVELCHEYGQRLSKSVQTVLAKSMTAVASTMETRHAFIPLAMDPPPPAAQLEKMAAEPPSYSQRWAARILKDVKSGKIRQTEYQYPIQAWRLGGDQLWITLGGEVVVDYALRFKAELGEQTWIGAYANDVMAYIPSKRVLLEGGYEGQSSMMVYGLPTERWKADVEERVVKGVLSIVRSLD